MKRHRKIGVRHYAVLLLLCSAFPAPGQSTPGQSSPGQSTQQSLSEVRALVDSGKVSEAEARLRSLLGSDPSSPDAHFLLGYVLFRKHQARESLGEFTAGARSRRPNAGELKIVASDYVLLGDFPDADTWFSEVVKESPGDADARYLLGRTKFNENDFPAAIESFEQALKLRPKFVEAENNLGLALRELNQLDKAQTAFLTAIEWQGEMAVDAQPFLNLGTLLADRNKDEEAIPYLERAAVLAPANPAIREELAHVYLAGQNLPKARAELEQAVALAPGISSLHFKLGQIYRKQGLTDRARKEFEICARLSGAHSSERTPNPISNRGGDQP